MVFVTQVFDDTNGDENMVPKKAKVTDNADGEGVINMNTDRQPSALHGAENVRQPDLIMFTPLMEKKMDVKVIPSVYFNINTSVLDGIFYSPPLPSLFFSPLHLHSYALFSEPS